jgi:hypothetical protein
MRGFRQTVLSLLVRAAFAVAAASLPVTAAASPGCGNGVVEGGEECDGGPFGVFVDGDPARGPCQDGSRCYFRFTCCKFNCQYVGTPGAPCEDGNQCTSPDTCDHVGVCHEGPKLPDGSACTNGVFCDGAETCHAGVCNASTGDPCPQGACTQCQEQKKSCFKPEGTTCSDGSDCVDGGTCDGGGRCRDGVLRSGACDDGVFCNGSDQCSAGSCSQHSGSPCAGGDGDADCSESCDENSESCNADDPDGSSCDDATFCNGDDDRCTGGVCTGSGLLACDDDNSCTTDACNEAADTCTHQLLGDGTACDDRDLCTLDDLCAAGVCTGYDVLLRELCPWTLVLREQPDGDVVRTRLGVSIDGDSCGGTLLLGAQNRIVHDLVSGTETGTPLRIAPDTVVGEDIVSAGGAAQSFPSSDFLPYLDPPVATLEAGSVTERGDGAGSYDLSGAHGMAGACIAARGAYATAAAAIDALPPGETFPSLKPANGETLVVAAAAPGGLNVVDVDGPLKTATDSTLVLDGGGDAATVLVVRIAGRLKMKLRSQIVLAGGLLPERTLVYVKGRSCQVSDLALGSGTLLCTPARARFGYAAAWIGAVFADGSYLKIGDRSTFLYEPFRAF